MEETSSHEGNSHILPFLHPLFLHVSLCLHHWTLRRILCFWIQESIQDQGLRRHHPRSWRHHGQIRLSVPDGNICQCLHSQLHQHPNTWKGKLHQLNNLGFNKLIIKIFQLLQQVYMLRPEEQLELFHGLEDSLMARGILQPPALPNA